MIAWVQQSDHEKMTAYCAWLIVPTNDGCKVVSNHTRNGPKTKLAKNYEFNVAAKNIRYWLVRLKQRAENSHTIRANKLPKEYL